jgi:hypothetical protein
MTQSYSNALLKFILTHYIDILYSKITIEEMGEYCHGKSHRNPLETALLWKVDVDRALVNLAPAMPFNPSKITSADMIIQIARSNDVSRMQRSLISDCILKNCEKICKRTGYKKPETCWNESVITRLRHFLNGDVRDGQGRFIKQEAK